MAQVIQDRVEEASKAKEYFSGGWETYFTLSWHFIQYQALEGKSEMHSVEADMKSYATIWLDWHDLQLIR